MRKPGRREQVWLAGHLGTDRCEPAEPFMGPQERPVPHCPPPPRTDSPPSPWLLPLPAHTSEAHKGMGGTSGLNAQPALL